MSPEWQLLAGACIGDASAGHKQEQPFLEDCACVCWRSEKKTNGEAIGPLGAKRSSFERPSSHLGESATGGLWSEVRQAIAVV